MDLLEIEKTMQSAKFARDVKRYKHLIEHLHKVDVSKDSTFQRIYNGFFQLRRNETYRIKHFTFLEEHKADTDITFETILKFLSSIENKVEASFATKMLSTINPNMPVWDRKVLQKLSLKKPKANSPTRIKEVLELYEEICSKIFTENADFKKWIDLFDKYYPNSEINPVKKIDFVLWQMD